MSSVDAYVAHLWHDRIVAPAVRPCATPLSAPTPPSAGSRRGPPPECAQCSGAISNSAVLSAIHDRRIEHDLLEAAFDAAPKKL